MFFQKNRIANMRRMIMSDTKEEREAALSELMPYQKTDFIELFEVMNGLPVTIRLLDPPLHEFLPKEEKEFSELSRMTGKSMHELKEKTNSLHELNPMLGHRGCRLAVSYPEIAEMQTRAIIEAAVEVKKHHDYDVVPEIMIPLVVEQKEMHFIKDRIDRIAKEIIEKSGVNLQYKVGTMLEIPRACLMADEIAKEAEFFSFGTNDLTQMTYGLSRDDTGPIMADYIYNNIFEVDPTSRLDRSGVGQLMKMAVEKGRKTKPDGKFGICGEHGGDPYSIEFCHMIGLNYVSCSPFRVPRARLAAAQSAIKEAEGILKEASA
jgi:pyruvate,orthophosphate dikinase